MVWALLLPLIYRTEEGGTTPSRQLLTHKRRRKTQHPTLKNRARKAKTKTTSLTTIFPTPKPLYFA